MCKFGIIIDNYNIIMESMKSWNALKRKNSGSSGIFVGLQWVEAAQKIYHEKTYPHWWREGVQFKAAEIGSQKYLLAKIIIFQIHYEKWKNWWSINSSPWTYKKCSPPVNHFDLRLLMFPFQITFIASVFFSFDGHRHIFHSFMQVLYRLVLPCHKKIVHVFERK